MAPLSGAMRSGMAAPWFCACCRSPGPGTPRTPIPPEAPPNYHQRRKEEGLAQLVLLLPASTRCGRTGDRVGQAAGEQPVHLSARPPTGRGPARAGSVPTRHSTAPRPRRAPHPSGRAEAIHDWAACPRPRSKHFSFLTSFPASGWRAVPWPRPAVCASGPGAVLDQVSSAMALSSAS